MCKRRPRRCKGGSVCAFSLVELLVVVGIITVLLLVLLPAIQRSIRQAAATVCMHNLREINHGLQMYRMDNNGSLPVGVVAVDEPGGLETKNAWFDMLFPRYLGDLTVFRCPDDPFRHAVRPVRTSSGGTSLKSTSYGLSDFLMSSVDAHLANLDRCKPKRPHDTLLVADVGPDNMARDGDRALQVGQVRAMGRLPWDDNFEPGRATQAPSWLTDRHGEYINVLAVDGSARPARTREAMARTIEDYYPACAAGGCPLCEGRVPHYSFAESHVFWWTGSIPQP